MVLKLIIFSDMILAMVPATLCSLKIKKAIKLNAAAHITAWKGVRTFVETMVAIELAAS
jgi:hypothetical protein